MYETITYRRTEIYDQIWSQPTLQIAKIYGISDVALAKVCRRLSIPLPGRGYWAKKKAGKATRKLPLPPLGKGGLEEIRVTRRKREDHDTVLNHKDSVMIEHEKTTEAKILVCQTLTDPHPLVVATAKQFSMAKPEAGRLTAAAPSCLDVTVGPESVDRALRILDAILKAAEARGHRVVVSTRTPDYSGYRYREELPIHVTAITIGDDDISFRLEETTEYVTVPPPLPMPPPKRRSWDYVPPSLLPTKEHRPTGRLSLRITGGERHAAQRTWNDARHQKLENCLNSFLSACIRMAASMRENRIATERRRIAEEEAKRKREAAEAEAQR